MPRPLANRVTELDPGPRIWVDRSVLELDRRIKEGDESGWRGDPTMGLFLNPADPAQGRPLAMYEVWGTDLAGNRYLAASHHKANHELMMKLVMGDPRKHDVIQRVLDDNAKHRIAQAQADREQRMEAHEKLAWAIRQDFGHLAGGRRRVHSMYDATKDKENA